MQIRTHFSEMPPHLNLAGLRSSVVEANHKASRICTQSYPKRLGHSLLRTPQPREHFVRADAGLRRSQLLLRLREEQIYAPRLPRSLTFDVDSHIDVSAGRGRHGYGDVTAM